MDKEVERQKDTDKAGKSFNITGCQANQNTKPDKERDKEPAALRQSGEGLTQSQYLSLVGYEGKSSSR